MSFGISWILELVLVFTGFIATKRCPGFQNVDFLKELDIVGFLLSVNVCSEFIFSYIFQRKNRS